MPDPTPLSTSASDFSIRNASEDDMPAVAGIYAHYVETSATTYEEVAPNVTIIGERFKALSAKGLPYLVAEDEGQIVGFAYAGLYRDRAGYRYTVEDSVYVDKAHLGQGVGRALLSALIEQCSALGYRQMIAVIGDSANAASIALHSQLGFKVIGALDSTGRKFDLWIDTVLMQRALGDGSLTAPDHIDSTL